MKTKFILIFLKAVIQVLLESVSELEKNDEKDCDGLPLSDEWNEQTYMLASLRSLCKVIEDKSYKLDYEE